MSLPIVAKTLHAVSASQMKKIRRLEDAAMQQEQVQIETMHSFHAGMYTRTITIPAGVLVSGALMKIATILIVSGEVTLFNGVVSVRLSGYNVLEGMPGRKSVFLAHTDTSMSMVFPTQAKTVDEAEQEFTEEFEKLLSRRD